MIRTLLNTLQAFCLVVVVACASAGGPSAKDAKPITDLKPTVLLISFDGFRWDYLEKNPTPNLHKLMQTGARAKELVPIYPSVTFPNHYTIVTGLYAEHHGIVGNEMWDPQLKRHFTIHDEPEVHKGDWWGGEPLWQTVQKQGQLAASMYWVGSTSLIPGGQPKYFREYDRKVTPLDRVQQILDWLDLPVDQRPTFLTLYFEDIDNMGHGHGPESVEVKEAVAHMDEVTGKLWAGLEARGIADKMNLVFVSDHGMAPVVPDQLIPLGKYTDLTKVDVIGKGSYSNLFLHGADEAKLVKQLRHANPHLHIYRKSEIPARFHYRNNRRIAPVLAVADEGWTIVEKEGDKAPYQGIHGYDNLRPDMHGIFLAHGPAFKSGYERLTLENIHIYDLLCKVLGLKPAKNDGKLSAAADLLR